MRPVTACCLDGSLLVDRPYWLGLQSKGYIQGIHTALMMPEISSCILSLHTGGLRCGFEKRKCILGLLVLNGTRGVLLYYAFLSKSGNATLNVQKPIVKFILQRRWHTCWTAVQWMKNYYETFSRKWRPKEAIWSTQEFESENKRYCFFTLKKYQTLCVFQFWTLYVLILNKPHYIESIFCHESPLKIEIFSFKYLNTLFNNCAVQCSIRAHRQDGLCYVVVVPNFMWCAFPPSVPASFCCAR